MSCLLALLMGCTDREAGTISVGVLLPLSGGYAGFGETARLSYEMAAAKINEKGGIGGRPLELIFGDTQGKDAAARAEAGRMIGEGGVVLLTGCVVSSAGFAVAEEALASGVPLVISSAPDDRLTAPWAYTDSGRGVVEAMDGLDGARVPQERAWLEAEIERLRQVALQEAAPKVSSFNVFRVAPPMGRYSSGWEGFLSRVLKPRSAVVLYEDTVFGARGLEAFERTAEGLGIALAGRQAYRPGADDYSGILKEARDAGPDLIYLIGEYEAAARILKQASAMKLRPAAFAGSAQAVTLREFYDEAGSVGDLVVSATTWHEALPIEGAGEYYREFAGRYNRPTEFHGAAAYASMQVIERALGGAQGDYSRARLREELAKVDMMTVLGPVRFTTGDGMVNQNMMSTYVMQWQDGRLVLVWPPELATGGFVSPLDGESR